MSSRKKAQPNQRDSLTSSGTFPPKREEKPMQRIPSAHDVFDHPVEHVEPVAAETKISRRKKAAPESQDTKLDRGEHLKETKETKEQREPKSQRSDVPVVKDEPAKTAAAEPIVSLSYSFIYFIRLLDNTKSDESTYKIGYSNDVPAYRKQLETNMPQNVKTMRVLHCTKGDADKLSAELCQSIKSRELRGSWFRIKKEELDNITNTLVSQHQCVVVSESKAVIKPAKKSRKSSN